jgi:hypothetical protein
MRAFEFSRCVLGIGVIAALLCGCGGSSSVPMAIDSNSGSRELKQREKFSYTGAEQTFIVPAGIRRLSVIARGGEGAGTAYYGSSDFPGFPGRVYAVIRVHPGEKLYVFVGGAGTSGQGGFNGGGSSGRGGGGATDVRKGGDKLKDRIIVAAGGGGQGFASLGGYDWGGDGGGLVGEAGGGAGTSHRGEGGTGGSQSQGGSGGSGGLSHNPSGDGGPGGEGTLGQGGDGGKGGKSSSYPYGESSGGGGGGGYYGGGGGGGGGASGYSDYGEGDSGGGGGGSSFVEPSAITSQMWTGWKVGGDGQVIFSWK